MKYILYKFEENVGVDVFNRGHPTFQNCKFIIKEKMLALSADNYETFRVKWENFTEMYADYCLNCTLI